MEDKKLKELKKENEMLKKITQKINAICNYEMSDDYIVVCSLDYFNKGYFKNNFIRKDKIRELQDKYKNKLERLESKKIWNEPIDTINKNRYTNYFNAYEELLEEV